MSGPDLAISAATQLCGVVLHPAGHTRSPAMHNAAFRSLGINAVYLAFDVPPEGLADAIRGARSLGVRQLAVSIPHKIEVMEHVDRVDETAASIGAVNTVTRNGDQLIGANTDWIGAVRALEQQGSARLEGARACVLGAGGAARSVVFGLKQRGAHVTILNRTLARAEDLCRSLSADASGRLNDLADVDHDVLVNTTRVGLGEDASPIDATALRRESLVMDAVYNPPETRLLRDASERGARTIGGKWWLVYQAAEQLTLWSGREAPIEVMATAFDG
jgi:shikimate dehydrogenase